MRPPLALPAVLWLIALLGFGVLAGFAAAHDTLPADLWVSHRLQEIDSPAFDAALDLPEALADLPYVLAVWLPAVAVLWLLRHPWRALLLLIAPLGWLGNTAVKHLVDRPRPTPELVHITDAADGPSFPSGHAITAVLIFGLLLYFATVVVRPAWLRLPLQLACLYAIVFSGLARIYHGVHWLSDVYGAVLLGVLILCVPIALDRLAICRPRGVTYPRLSRQ